MKIKRLSFASICFIVVALFWLTITAFPLYFTVISSLKSDGEIWGTMFALPQEYVFQNYIDANRVSGVLRASANSVFLSIASIVIMLACVFPASFVIARRRVKFGGVISTYFMVALMIPIHGALASIIQMASLVNGQNNYMFLAIVYAGLHFSMAFFITTGYIRELDAGMDEAACIDGCNTFQIMSKIILPVSKPIIATISIISFLGTYNELPIANVLLSSASKQTLSVALLAFKGDYQVNTSWTFAAVVLSMVPMIIFYLFCQENVEKGLTAGAVKG